MTALEGADGFKSIPTLVDDSNWEPEGVTLQVRFCEGGKSRGWPLLSQPNILCAPPRRPAWINVLQGGVADEWRQQGLPGHALCRLSIGAACRGVAREIARSTACEGIRCRFQFLMLAPYSFIDENTACTKFTTI